MGEQSQRTLLENNHNFLGEKEKYLLKALRAEKILKGNQKIELNPHVNQHSEKSMIKNGSKVSNLRKGMQSSDL